MYWDAAAAHGHLSSHRPPPPPAAQAMGRTRVVPLGETTVRFASAEDALIHKIVAGRPRDIEDARAILAKPRRLDRQCVSP